MDERLCPITFETVDRSYSENFAFRERLIDISISKKIMIYPKYMIVNKTELPLMYNLKMNSDGGIVKERSNDYLMGTLEEKEKSKDKLRFKHER